MPVTAEWDTEDKLAIRFNVMGKWTFDEMWEAYNAAHDMMDTVPHLVDMIFYPDPIAALHYPPGMTSNTQAMNRKRHARAGISITVLEHAGPVVRTMVNMASHFLPSNYQTHYTKSLEEARSLIAETRAKHNKPISD